MEERRCAYRVLVGYLREWELLENLDIYGKIILKFILNKSFGMTWNGLITVQGSKEWCTFANTVVKHWVPQIVVCVRITRSVQKVKIHDV
jgi:hypothetical protein